jgi:hypothetical protein
MWKRDATLQRAKQPVLYSTIYNVRSAQLQGLSQTLQLQFDYSSFDHAKINKRDAILQRLKAIYFVLNKTFHLTSFRDHLIHLETQSEWSSFSTTARSFPYIAIAI